MEVVAEEEVEVEGDEVEMILTLRENPVRTLVWVRVAMSRV